MKFIKSEKPVTTNHLKLGEIKIEVEVPQLENLEEAKTFCGGEDGLLEFLNSQIETNAKNGGRAALRGLPENANLDEARPKIQSIVKGYAPQTGPRGESQKSRAQKFDSIKALVESGQEFTREQLLEMLAAAK